MYNAHQGELLPVVSESRNRWNTTPVNVYNRYEPQSQFGVAENVHVTDRSCHTGRQERIAPVGMLLAALLHRLLIEAARHNPLVRRNLARANTDIALS